MEEVDAIVNAGISGKPPLRVLVTEEEDLLSLLEISYRE